MATKNIKGITIEIGGNTTKLQDALKGVDKQVYSLNSDLKSLNQALKLDPKNTELLAQKQDVLRKNIAATAEKLNTLKEAQRQMGPYNKLTEEQQANYRALSVEIAKSENALKSMNEEMRKTNSVDFTKLKAGLKKVGDIALDVSKKFLQISGAVGGALTALIGKGVKSYAELEQNLGGVETLFQESEAEIKAFEKYYGKTWEEIKNDPEGFNTTVDEVLANAARAYKTAGVSANGYMSGITSFAASLLQSVKNNSWEAMEIADMAFQDMSDNANKFGTDMSSIQNAYQGFAKQNYTMLDNLKLGYGGTKKEMERLLSDASKLTKVKYDISNLADVYNAIHAIQENLGVTGTTAKEAESTISGSVNSMKAAFDNFLNGMGTPEQLGDAISTVMKNVGGAIAKLAPSILSGIVVLIKDLLPQITTMIVDLVPQLITAISQLIDNLLEYVSTNTEELSNTISKLVEDIVLFITDNLPKIIEIALKIVIALAEGIANNIDVIIPAIIECILKIVETIILNLPKIIEVGLKLIGGLIAGISKGSRKIVEAIGNVINSIRDAFLGLPSKAKEWGKDMIQGLINGIKGMINKVGDAAKGVANKIKNFLHFSKPDEGPLRDYETWMPDFLKGLAKGMDKSSYLVKDAAGRLAQSMANTLSVDNVLSDMNTAMRSLNSGIENSVNPIINPAANSNPLIIQIENFNNNSESDIQSLAQKLEFYRKNTALARGGK